MPEEIIDIWECVGSMSNDTGDLMDLLEACDSAQVDVSHDVKTICDRIIRNANAIKREFTLPAEREPDGDLPSA